MEMQSIADVSDTFISMNQEYCSIFLKRESESEKWTRDAYIVSMGKIRDAQYLNAN